jgi:hypothetical protein
VHWYGNSGKMYKTVQIFQITCFTKVFYVTAFGFVGCILFYIFLCTRALSLAELVTSNISSCKICTICTVWQSLQVFYALDDLLEHFLRRIARIQRSTHLVYIGLTVLLVMCISQLVLNHPLFTHLQIQLRQVNRLQICVLQTSVTFVTPDRCKLDVRSVLGNALTDLKQLVGRGWGKNEVQNQDDQQMCVCVKVWSRVQATKCGSKRSVRAWRVIIPLPFCS